MYTLNYHTCTLNVPVHRMIVSPTVQKADFDELLDLIIASLLDWSPTSKYATYTAVWLLSVTFGVEIYVMNPLVLSMGIHTSSRIEQHCIFNGRIDGQDMHRWLCCQQRPWDYSVVADGWVRQEAYETSPDILLRVKKICILSFCVYNSLVSARMIMDELNHFELAVPLFISKAIDEEALRGMDIKAISSM